MAPTNNRQTATNRVSRVRDVASRDENTPSTIGVNVIDLRSGRVIAKIHAGGTCRSDDSTRTWQLSRSEPPLETAVGSARFAELMESITTVHYSQAAHTLLTGHRGGDIVIWR